MHKDGSTNAQLASKQRHPNEIDTLSSCGQENYRLSIFGEVVEELEENAPALLPFLF